VPKRVIGLNVLEAATDRLRSLYAEDHRLIISFSAGKDSGVTLELAILAAEAEGRLPVEVIMRYEEIMFPGTFEYAERMYHRRETEFHWVICHQPIINVFAREIPYWWVFDPFLQPEEWVRQPPSFAEVLDTQNIQKMTIPERFPPGEGKRLLAVLGLRASESRGRNMGIHNMKTFITKPNRYGVSNAWPIYDFRDPDIWKAINDHGWDYNQAYDTLYRLGLPKHRLRIAPPTLTSAGLPALKLSMSAWPQWFDKVATRLPGVRTAALFGKRAVEPLRRIGEDWSDTFQRECIDEAPTWIAKRARKWSAFVQSFHARHSTQHFPQIKPCGRCKPAGGSWKALCMALYMGDPFSMKAQELPYMEPDAFREGAGKWEGAPTW